MENEERSQELVRKVAQSTFDQIAHEIEVDLKLIRASLPTKLTVAAETAQDVQYCKMRQSPFGYGFLVGHLFLDLELPLKPPFLLLCLILV